MVLFLKVKNVCNSKLLAGDKLMSGFHLRQPGFTYSVSGPFTKNNERIQKFNETGHSKYISQKDLGKACFNTTWLIEISRK